MKYYVGTVFANDTNGRVVDIPAGATPIRVSETPGKHGGGVRIDFMLPVQVRDVPDIEVVPVGETEEYDETTYVVIDNTRAAELQELAAKIAAEQADRMAALAAVDA